jgi:hypothetical protein
MLFAHEKSELSPSTTFSIWEQQEREPGSLILACERWV